MTVNVNAANGSYNIVIKKGVLQNASNSINLNRKVLIVTDSGVPDVYAKKLAEQCTEPHIAVIAAGEKSKSFFELQRLISEMLSFDFSRHDCVVAMGGGVCGDLGGFAASVYMRGIDFYNIPTTLLSQVDSSVGGKTAVNFEKIKNLVGTFYQPKAVLIDTDTLKTLDRRQFYAGLVEAIKMAATSDKDLFEFIENSSNIFNDIDTVIERSVKIKAHIVELDACENGIRRVLNFGHTVGHAIESFYQGKYLHGECVGMGMLYMSEGETKKRIEDVLKKYGLPTFVAASKTNLLPFIEHDKKAQNGIIKAVYTKAIGTFDFINTSADKIFDYGDKQL